MPTDKVNYKGDGAGQLIPDFSDELKQQLRKYCPDKDAESDPVFGHPADEFVNILLSEAWQAKAALHWLKYSSTKGEIRAVQANLLKSLETARDKLRTLPTDFDRLLGVDADPLGCADKIDEMIQKVMNSGELIESLPDKLKAKKPGEKKREIAVNLALNIIRILKDYGLPISATVDEYENVSNLVSMLKSIGDDMGLKREVNTWKSIIADAKKRICKVEEQESK